MPYGEYSILTTKEAASRLGWTSKWLLIRTHADGIPFRRVGKRKIVYLAKDIAAYAKVPVSEL
jgi:hypothetical protein